MNNLPDNTNSEEPQAWIASFSPLKQEWIARVKVKKPETIYTKYGPVSQNTELHLAPKEIKEDLEVSLTAAIIGDEYFWNMDDIFKNSKDFALALMKSRHGDTLYEQDVYSYLSYELKKDTELFLLAAKRKENIGSWLPKNIIENKELVLEAMKSVDIYEANKDIREIYHLDKDIIFEHLKFHLTDLKNLGKRMVNHFSKKVNAISLINSYHDNDRNRYNLGEFYKLLPEKLQLDLDVVEAVLARKSSDLDKIHEDLRNDKGFILYAIEKFNCYAHHAGKELRKDFDIAKKALEISPDCLHLFPEFKENIEILQQVLEKRPNISNLNENTIKNRDLVLLCLGNCKEYKDKERNFNDLFKRTDFYNEDYDVMRLAVLHKPELLKNSTTLINDTTLSLLALDKNADIDLVSTELLYDRDLVLKLFKQKENRTKALKNQKFLMIYREDEEIAKLCLENNYHAISFFPILKAKHDFVDFAISQGLSNISYIDSSFLMNKEMAIKFIAKDVSNYSHIALSLRDDNDVINVLMRRSGGYQQFLNNSSKSLDKNFTIDLITQYPWVYAEMPDYSPFKTDQDIIIAYLDRETTVNIKISDDVFKHYKVDNAEDLLLAALQKNADILNSKLPVKDYSQKNKKKI